MKTIFSANYDKYTLTEPDRQLLWEVDKYTTGANIHWIRQKKQGYLSAIYGLSGEFSLAEEKRKYFMDNKI